MAVIAPAHAAVPAAGRAQLKLWRDRPLIADDGRVVVLPGMFARGEAVEIACDESGYEGDKLIGTTTEVFAHGSVRLDFAAAADCMRELRRRIRSPATEYKANHLLREKHRSVLKWLLGPSGPLLGHGQVYLIDKEFFVVESVVDLLVVQSDPGTGGDRRAMAGTLYREGRRAFGREPWQAFLVSGNNLMRAGDRLPGRVDAFFNLVEVLRRAGASGPVDEILRLLEQARPQAELFRARLPGNALPAMDPLIPAIVAAVRNWGAGGEAVAIVHDRQTTLSEERVAQLKQVCAAGTGTGWLAGLTFASAGHDPRVQMADVLAGSVRKIASDELAGRGDELAALLGPYLDPSSVWTDQRSWSVLTGRT